LESSDPSRQISRARPGKKKKGLGEGVVDLRSVKCGKNTSVLKSLYIS